MAKNYIFGPTELVFAQAGDGFDALVPNATIEDFVNVTIGSVVEIGNEKLPVDAVNPEANSFVSANLGGTEGNFYVNHNDLMVHFVTYDSTEVIEAGTYTVSIYTETEDSSSEGLTPITREEMYLSAIAGDTTLPNGMTPITRKEMFLQRILDSLNS